MAKAKKQKIVVDGTRLTVQYPTIKKEITIDVSKFTRELRDEGEMHGWKQRYGDLESGGTPQEKFAAAQKLLAANLAGNWEIEAAPRDDTPIVKEAAARILGVTLKEVEAVFGKLSEEKQAEKIAEWKASPKMKAEIAEIRAERAKAAAEEADDDEISL